MTKKLMEIKERLRAAAAAQKQKELRSRTGCCRITIAGTTTVRSGVTERDCRDTADDYPGATYTFQEGASCS